MWAKWEKKKSLVKGSWKPSESRSLCGGPGQCQEIVQSRGQCCGWRRVSSSGTFFGLCWLSFRLELPYLSSWSRLRVLVPEAALQFWSKCSDLCKLSKGGWCGLKFTVGGKSLEILVTVKMRANTQVQQCFESEAQKCPWFCPFPQPQMWTLSGSPSVPLPGPLPCSTSPWCLLSPRPSFSLPGCPPPGCSQVASWSPWAGPGSVIQNIIKRRSLACLNPELTFHQFGMRLACEVWSCQAYTSQRWPSWAGWCFLHPECTKRASLSLAVSTAWVPFPPSPAMLASWCHSNVISQRGPPWTTQSSTAPLILSSCRFCVCVCIFNSIVNVQNVFSSPPYPTRMQALRTGPLSAQLEVPVSSQIISDKVGCKRGTLEIATVTRGLWPGITGHLEGQS